MIMGSSQYEARPCVALHCVAPIVNMLQLNAKIDQKPILAYALASKHNARRKTLRHIVNQPLDWVYPCYSHNLSPSLISHLSFLTASHHLSSVISHSLSPSLISHLSFLTASRHLSSLSGVSDWPAVSWELRRQIPASRSWRMHTVSRRELALTTCGHACTAMERGGKELRTFSN